MRQPREKHRDRRRRIVVPIMLAISSCFMALAWIGHLKFEHLPFHEALLICWLLVLPEYALNVGAIRYGYGIYSGAQMAAFNLCSGVVCVALVARFWLGEALGLQQILGFSLMVVAMLLIALPGKANAKAKDAAPRLRGARRDRDGGGDLVSPAVIVPILLFISSVIMAFAWLGHIRFRTYGFRIALFGSWFLVLPEYILNVIGFRLGKDTFTGAQMAAFNMAAGVICVALVARLFLKEPIRRRQWLGFALMVVAIVLIRYR